MEKKKGTFALSYKTIDIIFENKLTKNEVLLLIYIARRMGNEDKAYFDNRLVAKNFGLSHHNIMKAKSSLKLKGFIFVQDRYAWIEKGSGFVAVENSFFSFISNNSFTAPQLKAMIFIVKTLHQTRSKSRCYISKKKFHADTDSSPSVILKIIRLLVENGMLIDTGKKNRNNITYYEKLNFSKSASIVISAPKWNINFNGGNVWTKQVKNCS